MTEPAELSGWALSAHALERMNTRAIPATDVSEAIERPHWSVAVPGKPWQRVHHYGNVGVVLDPQAREVVTIYRTSKIVRERRHAPRLAPAQSAATKDRRRPLLRYVKEAPALVTPAENVRPRYLWSLQDARSLLDQGYSLAYVARRTGVELEILEEVYGNT